MRQILGYLVHRKPTYHCTDVSSPTGADVCSRFDDNYCSPETEDCSFPGSLDYCGLGDQECYQLYIDEMSVYTESLFGIKPAFVVGADRHGIWGWDWLAGYQSMLHRDGTRGYDTAGFAHIWSYPDQVTFSDTRGKNDGPWDG